MSGEKTNKYGMDVSRWITIREKNRILERF
jgi:hypothetical protein